MGIVTLSKYLIHNRKSYLSVIIKFQIVDDDLSRTY